MSPTPIVAVVAVSLSTGLLEAQELSELAARLQASVVVLEVNTVGGNRESFGTGFFISADGHIATNHHVVEGAQSIRARTFDDETLRVEAILTMDEENDLAIVLAEPGHYVPLTLGRSNAVSAGDRVVVLGNPLGLDFTLSEGIVSAVREAGKLQEPGLDVAHLQISAPIDFGSSGSPVVRLSGDVVGVVASGYTASQNLNFAVPVDLLRALEGRARTSPSRTEFASERTTALRNLGLSAVFFVVIVFVLRRISAPSRGR